jgi:NAD(P)-dependent dehydrogenase (short-subunit alcohol dehydrogenase family)
LSEFHGKVTLVTGGGSGIGLATAVMLGKRGARVVITERNQDHCEAAVQTIKDEGGSADYFVADLSKKEDVDKLFGHIGETFGRLDCAFNNAGIAGELAATADITEEDWDVAMNINLKAVWRCMRHEIKIMLAEGKGSIVNTASAAGLVALPGAAAYVVAKHGVAGLTKNAAIEYVKNGIRVNAVCPSFVGTPLTMSVNAKYPDFVAHAFQLQPIGRVGTPDEIAETVCFLLSDASSFTTGALISADGGYVAQ